MKKQNKRYPKGYFVSLGIALGLPLGIPLWLTLKNPGMMGAGIAIGVAIGTAMESQYNKNPRSLTVQEKRNRKIATFGGLIILLLGLVGFLSIFFGII
jgi:hypothetical protein